MKITATSFAAFQLVTSTLANKLGKPQAVFFHNYDIGGGSFEMKVSAVFREGLVTYGPENLNSTNSAANETALLADFPDAVEFTSGSASFSLT